MGISLEKGGAWQNLQPTSLQRDDTEQKLNLHASDTGLGGQHMGQGGRRGMGDGEWRGDATGSITLEGGQMSVHQ